MSLGKRLFYYHIKKQVIKTALLLIFLCFLIFAHTVYWHTHAVSGAVLWGSPDDSLSHHTVGWRGGSSTLVSSHKTHRNMHLLTDSSRPGFKGLKLQEIMMALGLIGAEVWNVHFRRTSVPLTASTSPDVYMRIPLTCSMPAAYTQTAKHNFFQKIHCRAHIAKNEKKHS